MDDTMQLIGKRIKALRLERGMQQTELAEAIGVSQTHMSNMESGRTGTTVVNLLKLYKILDCPISEFFVDFEGAVPVKQAGPVEEVSKETKEEVTLEDIVRIVKYLKRVNIEDL